VKERRTIKSKTYVRGYRYLADARTGIIHDMLRVTARCGVKKIAERHESDSLDALTSMMTKDASPCPDCCGSKGA
jgi:hypothetical protein